MIDFGIWLIHPFDTYNFCRLNTHVDDDISMLILLDYLYIILEIICDNIILLIPSIYRAWYGY